jgi:phage baseplate assembly protein gpV
MTEPGRFHKGVDAVPAKTLQRSMVQFNDGSLIREDEKCSIVTKLGALVTTDPPFVRQ